MKVAFFVEGYTEQHLLKKIALYNYGEKDLSFALFRLRGGGKKSTFEVLLDEKHDATSGSPKFSMNIYDCGGFDRLQSLILRQETSLHNNGFDKIVGIRDVHPDERKDITKLRMFMPYRIPQKPIEKHFLLCVMETEAWFIADEKHFIKISETLTSEFIRNSLGIDITTVDVETFDLPASTLNDIYNLAGESYDKTLPSISRTIDSLDIYELLTNLRYKITGLNEVLNHLD
jgi:hypothetical protein